MTDVLLSGPADFAGWRAAAMRLIAQGVEPAKTHWGCSEEPLFVLAANDDAERKARRLPRLAVPKRFLTLARSVIQHRHAIRFALLYRLLWRLRQRPDLLADVSDSEVIAASAMDKAVQKEIGRTKAALEFCAVPSGSAEVLVAWFEPHHHILESIAPFFVRRFGRAKWSILTPRLSAHWNGRELAFGQGADATFTAPASERYRVLPYRRVPGA